MKAPRRFSPVNRLALALRTAAPRSVTRSLGAASANLLAMAGDCRNDVDRRLDLLSAACARSGDPPSQDALQELYALAAQLIGVASVAGLPELDEAAASLCEVTDGMMTLHEPKLEPIEVHVSAMRLLRSLSSTGTRPQPVLEGLAKVRQRYTGAGLVPG